MIEQTLFSLFLTASRKRFSLPYSLFPSRKHTLAQRTSMWHRANATMSREDGNRIVVHAHTYHFSQWSVFTTLLPHPKTFPGGTTPGPLPSVVPSPEPAASGINTNVTVSLRKTGEDVLKWIGVGLGAASGAVRQSLGRSCVHVASWGSKIAQGKGRMHSLTCCRVNTRRWLHALC